MKATDLNAVSIFARVVELRSFSAAAADLRVPKSTVSLRVTQLEDRLGVRLLERTTRALRLTGAGEEYYQRAAGALEELRTAEREAADLHAEPRGRLRVTAPSEFGQRLLHDLLVE